MDMRHILAAAESTQTRGGLLTRLAGLGVEIKQRMGDDLGSAFSYEDLPSNAAGISFEKFLRNELKNNSKASISNTLQKYMETLSPQAPEDAPNYDSLIGDAYDEPTGNTNFTSKAKKLDK